MREVSGREARRPMKGAHPTSHALQRIRERVGVPKRSARRWARLALERGIREVDASEIARTWASAKTRRPGDEVVFYGEFAVLIAPDRSILTVYQAPRRVIESLGG